MSVPPVPRWYTCSVDDCTAPGVRNLSCSVCHRHLCAKHQNRNFHTCVTEIELSDADWEKQIKDEISSLLSRVNVEELVNRASKLKNNITCTFRPSTTVGSGAMMGHANYHASLDFEDGEKWLVRIPRRRIDALTDEMVDYLVESEFATLRFMEPLSILAPKAYGFGLMSDPENLVGVSYLFIEFLPGRPCSQDEARSEHVLSQIAEYLVELWKHPLPRAGSLVWHDNRPAVSKMASNRFCHLELSGPFDTAFDYYKEISEQYLDLIADGQVHHEHPIEAFAFYKLASCKADYLAATSGTTADEGGPEFFLKHVDDKGDHILVNDEGVVSGIIDWQFTRLTPANEAFGPSYLTAELEWLYSETTGITEIDKQLADALRKHGGASIAHYMEGHELARLFHHGLSEGVQREEARAMLRGWQKALGLDNNTDLDLDAWIVGFCSNDKRWSRVLVIDKI